MTTTTFTKPLNASNNDYYNSEGIRLSMPVYVDVPMSLRKELLNAVRTICYEPMGSTTQPNSVSGISVTESATRLNEVERFLGASLDNLRMMLFQRGGINLDLVLKLQAVSGITYVSEKDIANSFTQRKRVISSWIKDNQFNC